MNLKQLQCLWYESVLKPQSCLPIALFRICLGIIILLTCAINAPDFQMWFGSHGWVDIINEEDSQLDIFRILPANESSTYLIAGTLVVSAFMMTIGLATRLSTFLVWLCLMSFHNRFPMSASGHDALIRICSFFMWFSPAGHALSLDRFIEAKFDKKTALEDRLCSPWAQRLIQIEIACIYWQAFWGKIPGQTWMEGNAVYYVMHLRQLVRLELPFLLYFPWVGKLLTWFTLIIEFALFTLVWIKEFRYPVLLCGVILHIGIEITMNAPLFEYSMLSAYLLFVEAEDLKKIGRYLRAKLNRPSQNETKIQEI